MVEIITLPKLGISDEGELIAWEFEPGDHVEEGEVIALLESDKATAEVTATASGTLLKTYLDEGDVIPIEPGRPIAVLGSEGESPPDYDELVDEDGDVDLSSVESENDGPSVTKETSEDGRIDRDDVKATPRAKRYARENDVRLSAVSGTGPQGSITEEDVEDYVDSSQEQEGAAEASGEESDSSEPSDEVKATPRAKKVAEERGVGLSNVEGTGPQGAITEDDVVEYAEQGDEPVGGSLTVTERRSLSGTRRTIADRLATSAREKPHVMGTREISVEQLLRVQERLNDELSENVSLNDLILTAVARTLEDYPEFNAHFEDGTHELIEEVNIGYAVDTPKGLIVPVIEQANERSIPALATERRSMVQRVIEDRHSPDDLTDGTFTVTNVGVFDLDVSYSIINPPQVAILAIGRRKPTAFERDGEIRFEKAITFSLTIDHRVLDGADTGSFLARLADYIEYPGFALEALGEQGEE